jgi:hypothetical protein
MRILINKLSCGIAEHLAVMFCVIALCATLSHAGTENIQELELVFSADLGNGEQIFSSSYSDDDWTIPVQISDSSNFVFHPVISKGPDLKKWVVWTVADTGGKFLYYSVYNGSRWSRAKKIITEIKDNRSAALIVDNANTPWLAWEGAGKKYSDVFWSRWHGSGWDAPVKAHAENNVPDVQPELALDASGNIVLSWQTFLDGKYVTASRVLNGTRGLISVSEKKMKEKIHEQVRLPALPAFIKESHKATLFIKTKTGSESVPLHRF